MNAIIWTIWILTSQVLLLKNTTAKPMLNFAGNKIGKNKITTYMDVRFIDDDYDSTSFDPTADADKCANGATFCERIDNYPTTEVTSILNKGNKFVELFGSDSVNPIVIENRFGADGEEVVHQLCASQERLIYPQAGITRDNTWRYIVNQSNYTQGVRVEECINKRQCSMMPYVPYGYRSECMQKYLYRQLVAIDEEGNTIKDLFKIPSCCTCVLVELSAQN